jgi:ribose transport system permease protein
VGSVIGASAALAAYLMVKLNTNMVAACLIAVGMAALIGLLNGLLITKINIPPLIVTLAMMTGCRGISYIITDGIPIYGFPKSFSYLGQGYIWVIPIPVLLMILVMSVGYIVLNKTPFGLHIYGIGGNAEAARLSGVNVQKTLNIVYVISGALSGFAGIVLLSRINTGTATIVTSYEMDIITAVVLGGVSINGGEGKLKGVIMGVLIMGILSNGMIIMGISEYYQWIVRCIVLLLAVGFDKNIHKLTGHNRLQPKE